MPAWRLVLAASFISIPLAAAHELRPYQILVHGQQDAPGITGATVGFLDPPAIGQNGHVAVYGQVVDASEPNGNFAIWAGLPGNIELLARRGSAAPMADPGDVFDGFVSNKLPVGTDGSVAFQARLNGITGPVGVWSGVAGGVAPVFIQGHQAPGFPDGALFDQFFDWTANGDGIVALRGRIVGGGAGFGNDFGIWLGRAGDFELIAREDHASPLGAGVIFEGLSTARPTVNGLGEICFVARMGGTGIGLNNDEVLFKGTSVESGAGGVRVCG